MISLKKLKFMYEPYPVGFAEDIFDKTFYDQLIANWPPLSLFVHGGYRGKKYGLAEKRNGDQYQEFIETHQMWSKFKDYIKNKAFINSVMKTLQVDHHINLSYIYDEVDLSARFEFSAIPVDGGNLAPHTDDRRKIITLILNMYDGWDQSFGGGTAILKPKDITRTFDYINKGALEYEDVDIIKTFPFIANSCTIFVKTYNSLHAVMPMTGHRSDAIRKSLTINIELSR
jgi:hypothetical protein